MSKLAGCMVAATMFNFATLYIEGLNQCLPTENFENSDVMAATLATPVSIR
jgi:hypothetical protein